MKPPKPRRSAGSTPSPSNQALRRGSELHRAGDVTGAVALYQSVLETDPMNAEACRLMSMAARQLGDLDHALTLAERATESAPRSPLMHAALGEVLAALGRRSEAIAALRTSLRLAPNSPDVLAFLGNVLVDEHDDVGAERCLTQALRLAPKHPPALFYLATLAKRTGRPAMAQGLLERFIALGMNAAVAVNNLGQALEEQGLLDRAIEAYRRAIDLDQGEAASAYGNLLHALVQSDRYTPEQVFAEHLSRAARLAEAVAPSPRRRVTPQPRTLRIGYLSPDFRTHPVGAFIAPVLRHHDKSKVHVTCYYDETIADDENQRLRALPDRWRDVSGLDDDALWQTITEDRIDILVDLAVNTGGNRQPLFARRAAPVQMSYLGYAATTGLATMDFRLTDAIVDPIDATEHLHTERLLRLPDVLWCYDPPAASPPVVARSSSTTSRLRIAGTHRLAKIGDRVLDAWCAILREVPESSLLLLASPLDERPVRDAWMRRFTQRQIDPARIELRGRLPMHLFLERLGETDLALDSFPFSSGTTACHDLWMGCPVITLAERAPWSRVTASVLGSIGLSQLVTHSVDAYVARAIELSRDHDQRESLRASLRGRMQASPLTDAERFTRAIEAAFFQAWATIARETA